jgi:predicted DNA-binding transcriptional regulator AlpA
MGAFCLIARSAASCGAIKMFKRNVTHYNPGSDSLCPEIVPGPTQKYFDTKTAATYLGLSRQYLEIGRHSGYGPSYVKLARAVRYRKSDLDEWMAGQLRQHTAEVSNAGGY